MQSDDLKNWNQNSLIKTKLTVSNISAQYESVSMSIDITQPAMLTSDYIAGL
jgi:hypothetical protein